MEEDEDDNSGWEDFSSLEEELEMLRQLELAEKKLMNEIQKTPSPPPTKKKRSGRKASTPEKIKKTQKAMKKSATPPTKKINSRKLL